MGKFAKMAHISTTYTKHIFPHRAWQISMFPSKPHNQIWVPTLSCSSHKSVSFVMQQTRFILFSGRTIGLHMFKHTGVRQPSMMATFPEFLITRYERACHVGPKFINVLQASQGTQRCRWFSTQADIFIHSHVPNILLPLLVFLHTVIQALISKQSLGGRGAERVT